MKVKNYLLLFAATTLLWACKGTEGSDKQDSKDSTATTTVEKAKEETVVFKEEKYVLDSAKFASVYGKKIDPPAFDLNVNLANKNLSELRLLKSEILARYGFFFQDGVVRNFFTKKPWYQPIYWDKDFHVSPNEEEKKFFEKIQSRESEIRKQFYVKQENIQLLNPDLTINITQFESISKELNDKLRKQNFALAPSSNSRLFQVYAQNQRDNIPSFITTDLFIQFFQVYIDKLMAQAEETDYKNSILELCKVLHRESEKISTNSGGNEALKRAAKLNTVIFAVPMYLLTGQRAVVSSDMINFYEQELQRIESASEVKPSLILDAALLDYTEFKASGHYTKDAASIKYYKVMTWLGMIPLYLDKEDQLGAAMLTAWLLSNSKTDKDIPLSQMYQKIYEPLATVVGASDQLSMDNAIAFVKKSADKPIKDIITTDNIANAKAEFKGISSNKSKPKLNFLPKKSALDMELLKTLVNEKGRTMPKSLDVMAILGNDEAENLLKKNYNVASILPEYNTLLSDAQNRIKANTNWAATYYGSCLSAVATLGTEQANYPGFMKTEAWKTKCLQTALSTYTDLNSGSHPSSYLMAQNNCLPKDAQPATYISYVEPNVNFWNKSIQMLDNVSGKFSKHKLMQADLQLITAQLRQMAVLFSAISQKELSKTSLTSEEYNYLHNIGGLIQQLTLQKTVGSAGVDPSIAALFTLFSSKAQTLQLGAGNPYELYVLVRKQPPQTF